MNVEKTLEQLDTLLAQHRTNEIEGFLLEKIEESVSQGDTGSLITLMNELIGYYRENGEYEKFHCNAVSGSKSGNCDYLYESGNLPVKADALSGGNRDFTAGVYSF